MAEYTLNFIDERPVVELVEEVYELTLASEGLQGPSGKDAANVVVSQTPPNNPTLNDVWVKPNV